MLEPPDSPSYGLHIVLFSGPSGPEAPSAVRRALAVLPPSQMPVALLADMQLIASELLSNAVLAGADWGLHGARGHA